MTMSDLEYVRHLDNTLAGVRVKSFRREFRKPFNY